MIFTYSWGADNHWVVFQSIGSSCEDVRFFVVISPLTESEPFPTASGKSYISFTRHSWFYCLIGTNKPTGRGGVKGTAEEADASTEKRWVMNYTYYTMILTTPGYPRCCAYTYTITIAQILHNICKRLRFAKQWDDLYIHLCRVGEFHDCLLCIYL